MFREAKNIIYFLLFTANIYFAQAGWGAEVSLNLKERPLNIALEEIRTQADVNLIYNQSLFKENLVSLNLTSTADKILANLLNAHGYTFKKFENNSAVIFRKDIPQKKMKAVVQKTVSLEKDTFEASEITKPVLLSKVDIRYPEEAIRQNMEGTVLLNLLVNTKGNISRIRIGKSSGFILLDSTAINYVKDFKFLPAEVNGKHTEVWTNLHVRYNFE
jgi:TonB family protein